MQLSSYEYFEVTYYENRCPVYFTISMLINHVILDVDIYEQLQQTKMTRVKISTGMNELKIIYLLSLKIKMSSFQAMIILV